MARREWSVAMNGEYDRRAKSAGVRMNPCQHAGVGNNRQEKTQTEKSLGLSIGGGSGN
jgi:hypothetical protein